MCTTCKYAVSMATMIQIRNVPEDLHKKLKSRAALAGMSLSDYLLAEIHRFAERPTLDEIRKRLSTRSASTVRPGPAEAVRTERNHR